MTDQTRPTGGTVRSGRVCFVDTETLGLDPDHHPMWEVGLITPNGEEHLWQLRVTPREKSLAHPIALEIGRFKERYNHEEAWRAPGFCARFQELTRGCHLAGAVVSFDEERLRRLFWREGFEPGWHYHLIDVEALAVGFLSAKRPDLDMTDLPWDSSVLSQAVGVEPDQFDKHTALGDARWAKAIFEAVVAPSGRAGGES